MRITVSVLFDGNPLRFELRSSRQHEDAARLARLERDGFGERDLAPPYPCVVRGRRRRAGGRRHEDDARLRIAEPGAILERDPAVELGPALLVEDHIEARRVLNTRHEIRDGHLVARGSCGLEDPFADDLTLRCANAGPRILRAVAALGVGEVSEPLPFAGGFRVLRLVEREPDREPSLAEVEETVRAEWRRRAGDRALRDYLDRRDVDWGRSAVMSNR